MVKPAVKRILGKTIRAVVIKRNKKKSSPQEQLFLIFTDDTHYEFYIAKGEILTTGGVDQGGIERVRRYMQNGMEIIYEVMLDEEEISDLTE